MGTGNWKTWEPARILRPSCVFGGRVEIDSKIIAWLFMGRDLARQSERFVCLEKTKGKKESCQIQIAGQIVVQEIQIVVIKNGHTHMLGQGTWHMGASIKIRARARQSPHPNPNQEQKQVLHRLTWPGQGALASPAAGCYYFCHWQSKSPETNKGSRPPVLPTQASNSFTRIAP